MLGLSEALSREGLTMREQEQAQSERMVEIGM